MSPVIRSGRTTSATRLVFPPEAMAKDPKPAEKGRIAAAVAVLRRKPRRPDFFLEVVIVSKCRVILVISLFTGILGIPENNGVMYEFIMELCRSPVKING